MAEVKVRATAKLMRAGTADCERKYAIAFDASEGATTAALVHRLRSKEAFAGLSLAVEGVTVLDKDFDDYFEVDSADRLTHMGTYVVTFIEARSGRDERAVLAPQYVAQAIEDRLASTNGHAPEFAERKPTVRPPSASDDDIILCEPTPNVAARISGRERKPDKSKRSGLSAASIRHSSLTLSATAPPTSTTSIAKASSTSGTDSDKESRCSEQRMCKQEHNSASDAVALRAPGAPVSEISRARSDRPLSTSAIAPSPLAGNSVLHVSDVAVAAQPTQFAAARGMRVTSVTDDAAPSSEAAANVERQATESQIWRTRLMDVKSDHPAEEEKKNVKNLIAELAAADKHNAYSEEIDQGTMQMEWEEMEPVVTPKDEPTEAIPLNATLTSREMERFVIAMQEPYRNTAELPTESRSARVDADQTTNWTGARSELDYTSRANDSQQNQPIDAPTTSVKTGKIRLSRLASRSKASPRPPIEMVPANIPPPDVRIACEQTLIDQLRRNDQFVQDNSKATLEHPKLYSQRSLPARARPGNSLRPSGHLRSTSRRTQVQFTPRTGNGRTNFNDDAEPHESAPRQAVLGSADDEEKPFECDVCGHRTARKYCLTVHKLTHTGEKPYDCEECEERFSNSGSLSRHMRLHPGRKRHVCDVCGKAFFRSGFLVEHKRTHTGEKPYKCEKCPRRFATSTSLKGHTTKTHRTLDKK